MRFAGERAISARAGSAREHVNPAGPRACADDILRRVGAMKLENKVAVVTGSSRGIGRAIASALLREGMKVVISSRTQSDAERAAKELAALGEVRGLQCDVRDYDQARSLIASSAEAFGGIDVLVNNAGIGIFGAAGELSPGDFRAVIETNLMGTYYCCHEAIPQMRKRGGGYIINIGSLAGKNPMRGGSAYNASKFGLRGMSEAMMLDVRYDNIKVSTIAPGSVLTRFGGREPDPAGDWRLKPADIARVVVDLLHHDPMSLPSYIEMRPLQPPRK